MNPNPLKSTSSNPDPESGPKSGSNLPAGRRPLELTPLFWIAILVVGLLGLNRLATKSERDHTRRYLDGGVVVLRANEARHVFPQLGIAVEMPEGWSYLSVTADDKAATPTFVHEASTSIVRLQPFQLQTWPIEGAELEMEQFEDSKVEWAEIDHRRIGRWSQDSAELMITAITHQTHARLTPEVREFCSEIRLIPSP